ncbi:hypothetical protein L1887_36043 [Cichorium endivia]|nr:hypothetical protein L1887_36043 [Cichorium endivia]
MSHTRHETVINIAKPAVFTGGLEFVNLTYTVTKKKKTDEGKWVSQEADLLNRITGFAPKGCVTAVMGPSGAGKSTFLDGLAGRIASGSLKGWVPKEEKRRRVETLIEQLGLSSARNTYIGDEGTRGVSGARGQLMYQGSPKDVGMHLGRMGRKVPKGESPIEFLIDVIQRYDQSEYGVDALAEFVITGMRPPELSDDELSPMTPTPTTPHRSSGKKGQLQMAGHGGQDKGFDHSVRSPWNNSTTWSQSGIMQSIMSTPNRLRKTPTPTSASRGYYMNSADVLSGNTTPQSSSYTLNSIDYRTPPMSATAQNHLHLHPKFSNAFLTETWILMRRNFKNIRRTPELFLSRLMVLTIMGFMMATMFKNPEKTMQGITNRLSFFIFTVCLFFFSSNDAVPAFIQERFIFVRETSHNAYRASSYTIAGLITYLPFLLLQAGVYAGLTWFALKLEGPFMYFLIVLYVSLLSTNSFVVFVSSVVPNFILGYAAVIAFTALFFLFCGYFLNSHDIPKLWRWMNVISTMTYPYEGLLINEYQRDEVFGVNLGGANVTGVDILQSLHIYHVKDPKWVKVYVMLGWAVLYRVLFYIVLRFGTKNQRT